AIDILASISRVMKDIVTDEQNDAAENLKRLLAVYRESEDLINIGAYQQGSNAEIDEAISYIQRIWAFSKQKVNEKVTLPEVQEQLISEFARS
ncbi:flagellum-specific ATP synthase FliI, partial [Clostridium perfringens]